MNQNSYRISRYGRNDSRGGGGGRSSFGVGGNYGSWGGQNPGYTSVRPATPSSFGSNIGGMSRSYASMSDLRQPNSFYGKGVGEEAGSAGCFGTPVLRTTPNSSIFTSISRPIQPSSSSTGGFGLSPRGIGAGRGLLSNFNTQGGPIGLSGGAGRGMMMSGNSELTNPFNNISTSRASAPSPYDTRHVGYETANTNVVARSFLHDDPYEQNKRSDNNPFNEAVIPFEALVHDPNPNDEPYEEPERPFQRAPRQRQSLGINNQYGNRGFYAGETPYAGMAEEVESDPFDFTEEPLQRRGGFSGRIVHRGGGSGGLRNNFRIPANRRSISGRPKPSFSTLKSPFSNPKASDDKVMKVGVNLAVSPPIFQVMEHRQLGDKVFIMIPKQAKTVLDVKLHIAQTLGVERALFNLFVNGFRIPETEDVNAFACLSKNALVQIEKLGCQPAVDFSQFRKPLNKRKRTTINSGLGEDEPDKSDDEPSLLEPTTRRGRYSVPQEAVLLSPSKGQIIEEIILSDDDEEEEKNEEQLIVGDYVNSHSSSPDKLVIEETEQGEGEGPNDSPNDNPTGNSSDKEKERLITEEESDGDATNDANKEKPGEINEKSNSENVDGGGRETGRIPQKLAYVDKDTEKFEDLNAGKAETLVNVAGQGAGLGSKNKNEGNDDEIVILSSPEPVQDEESESESSVSTNFDENSNEPFFTINAIQAIPVGSYQGNETSDNTRRRVNGNRVSTGKESLGSPSKNNVQVLAPVVGCNKNSPSALLNPFAKAIPMNKPTPIVVDISTENSGLPTEDIEQADVNQKANNEQNIDATTKESIDVSNMKVLSDISQLESDSLIFLQKSANGEVPSFQATDNSDEADDEDNRRAAFTKLSQVNFCKLVGRCAQRLTLEPTLPTGERTASSDTLSSSGADSDSLARKNYIFVDFKDLVAFDPLIKE